MNTVACPQCNSILTVKGELTSESYLHCPYCKTTFKTTSQNKQTKRKQRGCFVLVAIVLVILYYIGDSDSTGHSEGISLYYVTNYTYAATSKSAYDMLVSASLNKDVAAITNLRIEGVIVELDPGDEVYLISSEFSYNIVREKGSVQQLWINTGVIKKK